jgi:hypothetical protein
VCESEIIDDYVIDNMRIFLFAVPVFCSAQFPAIPEGSTSPDVDVQTKHEEDPPFRLDPYVINQWYGLSTEEEEVHKVNYAAGGETCWKGPKRVPEMVKVGASPLKQAYHEFVRTNEMPRTAPFPTAADFKHYRDDY